MPSRLKSTGTGFRYDGTGTIYSGQSITITGDKQNTTADMIVRLYRINSGGSTTQLDVSSYVSGSGTVTHNDPDSLSFTQTGTTVTLAGTNFNSFISTGLGCIIQITCDGITDNVRILKVTDGAEERLVQMEPTVRMGQMALTVLMPRRSRY